MRVVFISPRRQAMASYFTSKVISALPEAAAAERGRSKSGERS